MNENHPELYPAPGVVLLHFPKEKASKGGIIIPATARQRETGIGIVVRHKPAPWAELEAFQPGLKVVVTGDAIIDFISGTDGEYAFAKEKDVVGYDMRGAE